MNLLNFRAVLFTALCMPGLAMAQGAVTAPLDVPGTGVNPYQPSKKTHAFPESKSYAEDTSLYVYVPPEALGKTTRSLLAMQADPNRAGTPHTMLGATATIAWDRYLNSFNHAIPEWFEEKIEDPGD
ncbi:DUF3613 domain-containing protein [Advenella sp. WQ 585]|uniref:DUF3613 domain-containing protein n=1 Tax=Advenella mandrilli TaxID=2800330 RepID=A0ABS1EBJ8_9BURK|nr:DUF3613 domain-containing protein [Advenella mandrilli]MBK1779954.1 DUF3613 domain-containing protein [Advenella mandrilli]